MESKLDNDFDVLLNRMSTILAPAMLDMMTYLGYEESFRYLDDASGEHRIYRSHLVDIIENPTEYFTPYASSYDNEDENDKTHRDILREFKNIKEAFIALNTRKTEAAEAAKWINTISIVYERKIITEKIKKQDNASDL